MGKLLVLIVIILVPVVYYFSYGNGELPGLQPFGAGSLTVYIGDVPVHVEVADTPEARERGLSGRVSLPPDDGLLFIFPEADYHRIWMKDMRFPIDVIWISEDLRVLGVTSSLLPETYPRRFEPPSPARFVLEVNAHFSESFGIRPGDEVDIPRALLPTDLR